MKSAVAGTRKSLRSEAALPQKPLFVEKAYAHVRDRILNSTLGPGESVRDKEVVAALGISVRNEIT
jgi:DNA-binding GntR family transcriptional regulator